MRSAITISLVPQAKGGPFVFWDGLADGCARAAELGFDAVEIFPPAAHALDIAELQGLLDHHKLGVAAIGTGGGWVVHKWTLTHPDAAAWLRTQATQNIRLLCDLFHMAIEEADIAVALRECGPLVGHVHFADSNRRAIGMGHTAVAPIVAALRDIGYKGYLSAEILPLPDADAAAKRTMESFRKFTSH